MKCNCQLGYDDCSFPDCYTKQELVDAIDAKNVEIRDIIAKLEAATKALENIATHSDGIPGDEGDDAFYDYCEVKDLADAALKTINEGK